MPPRPLPLALPILALAATVAASPSALAADDHRSAQHGIDLVSRSNGNYWMIWASSGGNPPTEVYTQDVWALEVDPANLNGIDLRASQLLLSAPEAQEPVSAAANEDGRIMLTLEDGDNVLNVVAQRYAVYESDLSAPIVPYPTDVFDGGHSGHVAAVDNRFVVAWSNDWGGEGVDGVCDLGSGLDVIATTFDSNGVAINETEVATGDERDWWPYVAGSPTRAGLLWQRFVEGEIYAELYYAVLDPETGSMLVQPTRLTTNVEYYNYSLEYVPSIDRFWVRGNFHKDAPPGSECDVVASDLGFGYLIDPDGNVTASHTELSPIVRESQSVVRDACSDSAMVIQPRYPDGLTLTRVTEDSIEPQTDLQDDTQWDYIGTDGFFATPTSVLIASLSVNGLITRVFDGLPAPQCDPDDPNDTDGAGTGGQADGTGGDPESPVSTGSNTTSEGDDGATGGGSAPTSSDSAGQSERSGGGCACQSQTPHRNSWKLLLFFFVIALARPRP